jgi:ABC-type branched-subunit amino acid transport system ATPase component
VVLNGGQAIAEGKPQEIRKNREVLDAYLGYA